MSLSLLPALQFYYWSKHNISIFISPATKVAW